LLASSLKLANLKVGQAAELAGKYKRERIFKKSQPNAAAL
jgi:hypothetical protein